MNGDAETPADQSDHDPVLDPGALGLESEVVGPGRPTMFELAVPAALLGGAVAALFVWNWPL